MGGLAQFLPQTLVFYCLVSGLVGAYSMFEIRERSTLLRASFIVGVTNVITGAVFLMLHGVDFLSEGLWVMGGGLFGGVSTYVFLMALIPAYEGIFRYTTDIKLLELANMNHPSLKELAIRAPGTYTIRSWSVIWRRPQPRRLAQTLCLRGWEHITTTLGRCGIRAICGKPGW